MLTEHELQESIGRPMTAEEVARATPVQREWHRIHEDIRQAGATRPQGFGVGSSALRRLLQEPIQWPDDIRRAIGEVAESMDPQQARLLARACLDRVGTEFSNAVAAARIALQC